MLSSLTAFLSNNNSEFEQFVGDTPISSSSGLNFQISQKNNAIFEQAKFFN